MDAGSISSSDGSAVAPLGESLLEPAAVEPRETSGITSKLVLAYAQREGGHAAVEEILRRCGLEGRERDLRDENHWFSFASKIRLFEAAAGVLDDPHVTRRIGAAALDLEVGSALKVALRSLGTPGLVYRNVVRANAKFNSVQEMELLELERTRARIRFVDLAGVGFHRLDCDYNIGLLSCVPVLFGQRPARVSHPVCGVSGGDACVYDVSWDEHVSAPRLALVSGGAGAAALGVAALLAPPLLPAAAGLAVAGGGVAAWTARAASRRRWKQLHRELREHSELGQRLAASLQDLVGELRLDELLAKITRNAQAAVGGKEFALLVSEAEGGIRCRSSSGLPAATVHALERWLAVSPTGTPEPLVVDDLTVVPELAPAAQAEAMPLRSLCSVPLLYGGRSLGALVALGTTPRSFLPSDVDLLRSYAVQAAIALTNARLFEEKERLAARDPLTGLLNRRELQAAAAREINRSRRHGGRWSIVLLDLDHFKLVNDTGGHSAGDEALRRVAGGLSRNCRGSDLAFRIGGDEFALLLGGTPDRTAAAAGAARAQRAVAEAAPGIDASYGIAVWPDDGDDIDALLRVADGALYAMKGRQRARARA